MDILWYIHTMDVKQYYEITTDTCYIMVESENNYADWNKLALSPPTKRVPTIWFHLHKIIENAKLIHRNRRQWFSEGEVGYGEARDKDYTGYEETTGGFRYVHYLDYGNGFLFVNIYQNFIKLYILNVCNMSIIP